jgi:hypothetical protein
MSPVIASWKISRRQRSYTRVSYTYFDSAVNVADQIAYDILAWLVRTHREMTAELKEARSQRTSLTGYGRKLHASGPLVSRNPLPQGTPADRLARDLRGWFRTLNYGIEKEAAPSDEAFEWVVNVPERRAYLRVLVCGVEGEA